jgi:hypothetical protein
VAAIAFSGLPVGLPLRSKLLTILAVGEDFDLLKTRADVLRKTGANVLCSSAAAALKFIAEWEFDLVALCHSVRQRDAERITDAAHDRGAKTLVLLLVSDGVREQEYDGISPDASSFVEPNCLIRSAAELLSREDRQRPTKTPQEEKIISSSVKKRPASYPAEVASRRALIANFENRHAG